MYSHPSSNFLILLKYGANYKTASTLTFAVYMLTQHPNIVRRLREEVLNKVGHDRPTFEQMKEMKFLRAFINGALNSLLVFALLIV
jgi:cytochrome P450